MANRKHVNDDGNVLDCSTTPEKCEFSRNGDHLEPNASPDEIRSFYQQAEQVAQSAAGKKSAFGAGASKSKKKRSTPGPVQSTTSRTFSYVDTIGSHVSAGDNSTSENEGPQPVKVQNHDTATSKHRRITFYDGSTISMDKFDSNGAGFYRQRDKNGETVEIGTFEDGSVKSQALQDTIQRKAYEARGEAEFDDSSARIKSMAGKVDPNFRVAVHPKQMTDPSGGADRLVNVQGKTGGFFFIQKSNKDLDGNDKHFYGVVDNDTEDEPAYMKDDTRKSVEKMTARYLVAQKAKDDANDTTGDVHDYMMGFRKEPLLQGDE